MKVQQEGSQDIWEVMRDKRNDMMFGLFNLMDSPAKKRDE
jgi:hypothetical protein